MNSLLQRYIQRVRAHKALNNFKNSLSTFVPSYLTFLFIIIGLEFIFHFENHKRLILFEILAFTLFCGLFYLIIKFIIQYYALFGNYSNSEIAKWIGQQDEYISDRLLNCIELENKKTDENEDLINHAITKLTNQISKIPVENFFKNKYYKYNFSVIFSILIVVLGWKVFDEFPENALIRVISPKKSFEVPLPFSLISATKNQFVLGGDTAFVKLTGVGMLPDSINFYINSKDTLKISNSYATNDTFLLKLYDIKKDLIIYGSFKSTNWFQPWKEIASKPDTIFVQDRPVIEKINFTIIPPKYTNLEYRKHQGNNTNISVLNGSNIKINATVSKNIRTASAHFGKIINKLSTNEKIISGTFPVTKNDTLKIFCIDENDISNKNPTHYNIQTYPDEPPEIIIFKPKELVELDESMSIPLKYLINDDFGISEMKIEYKIKHPDYLSPDTNSYDFILDDFKKDIKSQNFNFEWNIGFISVMPEDEIHFRIGVADNNAFSGKSWSFSKILKAYYPSLEDMFFEMEENQDEVINDAEEISLTLDEVQELVEDLKLDLLKSDEMNWEQTQQTDEILDKMESVFNEMSKMSEIMETVKEQIEKNDLLTESLTDKFQNLQNLLEQLMTPEMKEALEKMQNAAEELDPEKMLQALEEFEFNAQDFEDQLDRFIEMFELAMAEQKMDEIQKKLQQIIEEQESILNNLDQENTDLNELAAREKRQDEEMEKLQNSLDEAKDMMQNISPSTSDNMDKLNNSNLMQEAKEDIAEAQKEFSKKNKESGGKKAKSAKEKLDELSSQFSDMKMSFQMETVAEMTQEFQRVVHNILSISKDQEEIFKIVKELKSKSPRLIETAVKQNGIQRQMQKLMDQVMELSTKTFYITPEIGQMLGKTVLEMNKSIGSLEQKKISSARKHQIKATEILNDAAYVLLDAMDQMNSSGSASGMEQFMEQMSKMSQQQQGINQGTMQLGQMGMMAQQSMMQKLMQQQQALQQSLEDLLGNNPSKKGSGLEKAKQDMEEVIKDFKKRKINQRTIERQEKILSRMLDSQRSMTQRDLSKKRKSGEAENFLYIGPDGLPIDYGERKLILMEAMDKALKQGYSQDYNKMIRKYFQTLQEQMEIEYENQ